MDISSYRSNLQLSLAELDKVSLKDLQDSKSVALNQLVSLIRDKDIKIAVKDDPDYVGVITDDEERLKKMVIHFLETEDAAAVKKGYLASGIENGIESIKSLLSDTYKKDAQGKPTTELKTHWDLREFLATAHFKLPQNRLDDAVINIFASVMLGHDEKRQLLRNELTALTAELKIYSVIQSEINAKLSAKEESNQKLSIDGSNSFNLLDYKKYGFDNDDAFRKSAEYQLLNKISSDSTHISIKTFLESPNKQSGAMAGLDNLYKYEKDNNRLANFSTSVNDRVSPLNNSVQEKTTRLNDISSRYNAAIEALNRFIQKYDSVMRSILGAI
ncbi:virulence-associated V antigen [Photorhabdus heterorhabditis]|uniref:Virulence factor n=1 Tax=Photorhabdus heterorhabditis TaxID=880156 RepID=A0A5B0X8P0_9GAMM|nr:virulence-associated V antigen [Photorhabdus heterorhabditis]KAA1194908.1 virulence factor [Photorhabdus heterorhabditis]